MLGGDFVRMVSLKDAVVGQVTAKPIYDSKMAMLVSQGSELTEKYLQKLEEADVRHVYIEDAISEGIELEPMISEALKVQAITYMKKMYESQDPSQYHDGIVPQIREDEIRDLKHIVDDIITEIYSNYDKKYYSTEFLGTDVYHFNHAVEVMILSVLIGKKMGIDRERLLKLGMGAILSDIGKAAVPSVVLNKRGKLNEEEFEIMKSHVEKGYNLLKELVELSPIARQVILLHHEKLDGSGYPNGFLGDQIPMTARIVTVCDIFTAIVSDRTYNNRISVDVAIEILRSASPVKLDADVFHHLLQVIDIYPPGTILELSNDRVGIVVKNNPTSATRPIVRLIDQEVLEEVDLMKDLTLFVKKALPKIPENL